MHTGISVAGKVLSLHSEPSCMLLMLERLMTFFPLWHIYIKESVITAIFACLKPVLYH